MVHLAADLNYFLFRKYKKKTKKNLGYYYLTTHYSWLLKLKNPKVATFKKQIWQKFYVFDLIHLSHLPALPHKCLIDYFPMNPPLKSCWLLKKQKISAGF